MTDVVVTVRGEHETRVTPEEAVARVQVHAEGSDRGRVIEQVSAWAAPIGDDLTARQSENQVAHWSSDRLSVWSERPWNAEGKRLAPVFHASVGFTVTFTDFTVLSWWASDVVDRDGVSFQGVEWRLTPVTRTMVERNVATEAVRVAVERATAYAQAIGRESVTPLEIADTGLLAHESGPRPESGMPLMARAAFVADAGGPDIRFEPADIVVSASVEARFAAR
jgi:hypothetical protein